MEGCRFRQVKGIRQNVLTPSNEANHQPPREAAFLCPKAPQRRNKLASKPQDASTQAAASTGAQSAATTASQNATTAQNNANNMTSTLFGTYNPKTMQYSGGTESANLNPSNLTQTGLTGSFANEYGAQANASANAAQQGLSTARAQQNADGMGKTPAGYDAEQATKAYQTQAQNNAANYGADFGAQNTQAQNNYANANNLLASATANNQTSATANNNTAAGTNTSLYGTASQQVPTALGTVLGTVGTLAGAAGAAFAPGGAATNALKPTCWVAAEIFGGWYEPRTVEVREWLFGSFAKTRCGRVITDLYTEHGQRTAEAIRESRILRWIFTGICNAALRQARKGA
jgi:hypothetical protein